MKSSRRLSAIVFGLCFALLAAPLCRAQADADTVQKMADQIQVLQKQLADLQSQMSALKASAPAAAPAAAASTPAGAQAATEPAKAAGPSLAGLLGSTTFSGFVDAYYGENFNNPASRVAGNRFFDAANNQFGLNMIEMIVDKPPDPSNSRTGYHIALGFGQAMNAVNGADPGGLGFDQYLKEAYFSYLAPVGKGLQIDVGKFVTPMGNEVIESKDNWNYSRGLLFYYAIPYFHYGMRAKYTFNDKYSLTGYFVNGWNDVIENNTGKTYGMSFGWNPNKKVSITQNYMAGPESANLNHDWRQLSDTTVAVATSSKTAIAVNYDYGRGDHMTGVVPPVYWTGIAGYFRYAPSDKYNFATRYEYYDDHYGFTTGAGTLLHLQEVTETFQRTIAGHIIGRLEYRHDLSDQPFFPKGASKLVKGQDTLTAGMIFTFDSREAK